MEIISGKTIADEIKDHLKQSNQKNRCSPCLAIIDIGDFKDNEIYINLKRAAVEAIGGITRTVKLGSDTELEQVLEIIRGLNRDAMVDGILLQLPMPPHLEEQREILLDAITPDKDVDGFCPHNRGLLMGSEPEFASCAAMASLDICRRYASPLADKKALLVGRSFDVIQPLALLLLKEGCSVCITPHYAPEVLEGKDIVVVEEGGPHLVKTRDIKNPLLLIDAGFYWSQDKACGNVDKEGLADRAGYLLPVPGGLGPLLIAQLMVNLSRAAGRRK
jgi:methylenetetrahydrofolate dehydrogenase (NADP+) / methenyltetrahydrofolate cyclohydrolase